MGNLCKKKKKVNSTINDKNTSKADILNENLELNHTNFSKPPVVNNFIIQVNTNPKSNNKITQNFSNSINFENQATTYPNNANLKPINSLNINYKTFILGRNYSDLLKEYDWLEHWGTGSFGIVQKLRHKPSNQIRAMKIIKKDSSYEDKHWKEIQNWMNWDHPHILKWYEFFYDKKNWYIITEFCEGGELFEKIKDRDGFFSEKDAAKILKQVLQAVAYCHSVGWVHRDWKPENILLEGDDLDNIKLIDFGTSNFFKPGQKFKQRLGTAYYIAPEVLQKNYDEKCDWWSIGVIMYIWLTGEPPINGKNDDEILKNVRNCYIDFTSSWFDSVSESGVSLLQKLWEKNPYKRLSALEAIDHPWIKNQAPNSKWNPQAAKKVFVNLKNFQADQKLQEASVAFIV
ncbi:MAG: serine/threonine-protein kinase, partial [Mycoplasma sp.]